MVELNKRKRSRDLSAGSITCTTRMYLISSQNKAYFLFRLKIKLSSSGLFRLEIRRISYFDSKKDLVQVAYFDSK